MINLPDDVILQLSRAEFVTIQQDHVIVFDLDFTSVKSRVDGLFLESGGQVFRSVIAFIGRLALQYPLAHFKVHICNIRKGRKPKVGMRPQHISSVDVVKTVLERCGRHIRFFDDFCEDSETLTIEFDQSECFLSMHNIDNSFEFNIGKINPKSKQPSEEAASLILQTWLMLVFDLFDSWTVAIGGGIDMNFSPPADFVKDVLGHKLGIKVNVCRGVKKTGTLHVTKGQLDFDGSNTISCKHLLDQMLVFFAIKKITCIPISCELTNHARSQIYLWEGLLGLSFDFKISL